MVARTGTAKVTYHGRESDHFGGFKMRRIFVFEELSVHGLVGFWALALRCRAISNGLYLEVTRRPARRGILLVAPGDRAAPGGVDNSYFWMVFLS